MKLSEYSDEDLIKEIRYRRIKIEAWDKNKCDDAKDVSVKIGGVAFDIK